MKTNTGLTLLVAGLITAAHCGGQVLDTVRREERISDQIHVIESDLFRPYSWTASQIKALDSQMDSEYLYGLGFLALGTVATGASLCGAGSLYENCKKRANIQPSQTP